MWLKNLTPVGLVSYLVVNYGYYQVLRLLDGNIEVAKQHLTTYFSKHDAEITPEQASYLANVAMQVLQTAGQIAVHQVAANRFNAVRKGGGSGETKPKTKQERIGEKSGAGRRGGKKVLTKEERINEIKKFMETNSSPEAWLGEGRTVVATKDTGDVVMLSKDGLRKFRTELTYSGKDGPHIHLEVLRNGRWRDAIKDMHRIYIKED